MNHLELWKLGTDVLLLIALAHLCFQFVRSPRLSAASRQLRDLEGALRALIREADGAGRTLNQQLLQRQTTLEKLLIDAQLAEQRFSMATHGGSEQAARPVESHSEEAAPMRRSYIPPRAPEMEPTSFPTPQRQEAEVTPEREEEESTITFGKTNIYGEPIEEKPAAPAMQRAPMGRAQQRAMATYSPLSAKIEKEIKPKSKASKQAPAASVEDIYASAEELLRAGNDLMAVAARTKLPIEEIRALSQMIIGERAVKQTPAPQGTNQAIDDDPRLGVMATMKRQTITL
jgi:hypothetical protein